jgi:hypothetical protein
MAEPYVRSEFKLIADIDGIIFKDVVGISATFGLNSIPTATLHVASGHAVGGARDGGNFATIHYALSQLKPRTKAKVTLTVKTNDGQIDKMMPDGDYVIFEGYYAGIGYQRSVSNSTYTIHLLHWIDDLNCSSMLNGNWFQGAPHDLAQSASSFAASGGGGSGYANIAPVVDLQSELINKGNMEGDLWAKVIKPIFEKVADMPHVHVQDGSGNVGGGGAGGIGGGDNKAAQDALKKMPGLAPIPGILPMALGDLDELVISYSANMGISHLLLNGIAYNSFWSKLIGELGASFLFGVSPGVEFANVIPYFGGLSTPWRTIAADEYNYASFNCNVASLIESVNIFYAQQSSSGYDRGGEAPTPMTYYTPWGLFPEKNQDFRGQILVRDPPAWISNPTPQAPMTPGTTIVPNGCSHTPQHGSGTPTGGAMTAPEAEQNIKSSGVLTRYCEHWFKSAVLGQRSGELSGKLRFDIAPGSTIKIQTPNSALGDESDMYAMVTQVSYVINAEQHVAGTSFSLTSIRTDTENYDNNLTAATPPMYKTAWSGGPLTIKY